MRSDILIIGAGGAGMRAAIAASEKGAEVIIVTKSLIGKAHTVMAEGGIAASIADVDRSDNWETHFSDTIVEGVYLGDWRMAELLAKEAPERVYELERYGAIFDRTEEGKIMQRAFGGHTYKRLCHIGDKTGLELIRTLEDKVLHSKAEIYDEIYITKLFIKEGRFAGALGIEMRTGDFIFFSAKATIISTGGCGRVYKITSNSWESTGDGLALAYKAGARLKDMEMVQFHPTGMVWPPGVRGLLVTESVRGEGGILLNKNHERFMLRYSPEKKELDARDVVARSIYYEIKAGNGTAHGAVYLDISHKGADFIKRKLPGMYSQFMEFAGVDITKEPMEVAPTVHYHMGGIEVDPYTTSTCVAGIFAAGEAASGLHGANRLGGNSLADILVFGKIAGDNAFEFANGKVSAEVLENEIEGEIDRVRSYLKDGGRNPYTIMDELTTVMEDYVGIMRNGKDMRLAIDRIEDLGLRAKEMGVRGGTRYNHGLLGCLEVENMLLVCEAIAKSALMREESRGAHTRSDFPKRRREWKRNIICFNDGGVMRFVTEPVPELPDNLAKLVKPEVYEDE